MANPNWVKGVSGNPAGRPKRAFILTDALREKLGQSIGGNGKTQLDAIICKLVTLARKGDTHAIQQIFDRLEGRPMQRQEISGPDGAALLIGRLTDEEILDYLKRAT